MTYVVAIGAWLLLVLAVVGLWVLATAPQRRRIRRLGPVDPMPVRFRNVRPLFDHMAMQRSIDVEHGILGPDLDSVPDNTERWI